MKLKYLKPRFLFNLFIGNYSLPLETKYFHSLTLVGSIAFLFASVFNALLDFSNALIFGSLIIGIISFLTYYLSRFKKKTELLLFPCAWFGLGIFIFLWLFNGGIEGGATYSYFILLGAYIIILNKKQSVYIVIASSISVISLLYIDYNFPEWISPFTTREERYLDVGISILIAIAINFMTNWVVFRNYKMINELNSNTNALLQKNLRAIRGELKLASKIQNSFFSKKSGSFPGVDYIVRHRPLSEVGGDIYSLDEIRPATIRILLADATGHGVQAALITMLIFSEYNHLKRIVTTPAEVLGKLNQIFFNKYANLKIYFSCIIVDLNIETGNFLFASAGHIDQYIIPQTGDILPLSRTGYLIGLKSQSNFQNIEYNLNQGDNLFLFTDGLTEEFNLEKEAFGEERLKLYLQKNNKTSLDIFLNSLLDEASRFRKVQEAQDDITMINIRKN